MKKLLILMILASLFASGCMDSEKKNTMKNPLLNEFKTPFGVPPFDQIKNEHFMPAVREAMKKHNEEIDAIVSNTEAPGFENTILALEKSGLLLTQVQNVFYNLNSSLTSDTLQKIAQEMAPEVSAHNDAIKLNDKLWQRIKVVYENKDAQKLGKEEMRLLEETWKDFVRGGANLNEEDKTRLKAINEQLSLLSLQFGQNVLAETNSFKLVVENEQDLKGLPANVIAMAAETARESGKEGNWVFTVQKPSMIPFLTYAENRSLRENLFKAYAGLGNNGNNYDNNEIIKKIIALRAEKAKIMGFPTHAHFVLDRNMAKTPETVISFLDKVWEPALKMAGKEAAMFQAMIDSEGGKFKLQPWDWFYYAEKVRKQKYDLDEETLSQYFALDNVRQGIFDVAGKLFGLKFTSLTDVPRYHPDVEVFEVIDKDGSHLGILYMDWFPRASKRAGAWMSDYRGQYKVFGEDVRPIVTTNFNFTKPTADAPALLTMDEVLTGFHEFGHALHGLLSDCTYPGMSGTNVARDFVELPSQIMENWAMEPEVLKSYAKHYKTGEVIPDDLIRKIEESRHFNQGFVTVEYLAASYLDLDYHMLGIENTDINPVDFEQASLSKKGLIPEIISRYKSGYFSHIFAGGYSAGYYAYIWAEILDADAFEAFVETGDLFNQERANSFRENILEKGGTADPMELYLSFRGKEPGIEPLLRKRGLDE